MSVLQRVRSLCSCVGVLALLVVSCIVASPVAQAHADGASLPHVTIWAHNNTSGTQFWFTMSSTTLPAGYVRITLVNAGTQDHMAQFIKLNPGVSEGHMLSELKELFSLPPGPATAMEWRQFLAIASGAGGADSITPGSSQDVIEHLAPGRYVVVCFDTTPQGVPHFALGMHLAFQVSGQVQDSQTPQANGTVDERDHQILVPATIHESEWLTLRVSVMDQTHEFQLLMLPPGTTRAQLLACLRGQTCTLTAPPIDAGGTAALAPGNSHWVILHLQPGTYGAVCFVPDIRTGMPHALMGMVTVFTVSK